MQNGEFNIDQKSKTVVFCQSAHGKRYYGKSNCDNSDTFDVVKGQLIAMKRCELNIRKEEIAATRNVLLNVKTIHSYAPENENKLWEGFSRKANETLSQHLNHVRELKNDIARLINNEYDYPKGDYRYETVLGSMRLVDNKTGHVVKFVDGKTVYFRIGEDEKGHKVLVEVKDI